MSFVFCTVQLGMIELLYSTGEDLHFSKALVVTSCWISCGLNEFQVQ